MSSTSVSSTSSSSAPAPAHISQAEQNLPFLAVNGLFRYARSPEQKQACLRYLLHYQHYNAEFTRGECCRLGYPTPLCAAQDFSGYVRTDPHHRLVPIIEPWVRFHFVPFLERAFVKLGKSEFPTFVRLSTRSAPAILETFFKEKMQRVKVIPLTVADLAEPSRVQEKVRSALGKGAGRSPDQRFLFILQNEAIDCVLMCAAKWRAPTKSTDLQCLMLDGTEMFEPGVFSLLNEAGDVPDRLAVNRFVTQDLGKGEFGAELRHIGMEMPRDTTTRFATAASSFTFTDDPGCVLYATAIQRWKDCFFKKYGLMEFASPLLSSQVYPWMTNTAGVVEWAKAYQNLCEIVLLCLETFPERFSDLDFEKGLLNKLDPEGHLARVNKTVGLYPYAMAPVFSIFHRLSRRGSMTAACISQNYFETLGLLGKMDVRGRIAKQEASSLQEIVGTPDVLIADIHPNNASRDTLFPNEVEVWVENYLNTHSSKSLVLILDITLNNLTDPAVQSLFKRLAPFIETGRLEIFWIQSLAKLVQMGADNLSGGVCGYVGKETGVEKPPASPQKAAFFALLNDHFPDLISDYFNQVRRNTEGMYQALRERFMQIQKGTWLKKDEKHSRQFCAAEVTTSGDDKTVYVALNFKPFLALRVRTPDEKEKLVKKIHRLILRLAELKGLPLAARQSFGFSLSNLSMVVDRIRFSIGVEKHEVLKEYADLIGTFSEMLSRYAVQHRSDVNLVGFEQAIEKLCKVWEEGEILQSLKVPMRDQNHQEEGEAVIRFSNHELLLDIPGRDAPIRQSELRGADAMVPHDFKSDYEVMKLLFQQICLDTMPLFVTADPLDDQMCYGIAGICEAYYSFLDEREAVDNGAGVSIVLGDQFCMTVQGTQLWKDQVAVFVEDLGTRPVKLSQLDSRRLDEVFTKCVRYAWEAEQFEPGVVILKFLERKPFLDYHRKLSELYKKGKLPAVVDFINELDSEGLPLQHDLQWKDSPPPMGHLCSLLGILGRELVYVYRDEHLPSIMGIRQERYRQALLYGMWEGLFEGSLKKKTLSPEAAQALRRAFSREDLFDTDDGYAWDNWINEMEKRLQEDRSIASGLVPYLTALFPLIQRKCAAPESLLDTDFSVPLRKVAGMMAAECPELLNHMTGLENALIPQASARIRTHKDITAYLWLYARYPFSDAKRAQLLTQLKAVGHELRLEWANRRSFYYGPIDEEVIREIGAMDSEVFTGEDDARIREFFLGIGGGASSDKRPCQKALGCHF